MNPFSNKCQQALQIFKTKFPCDSHILVDVELSLPQSLKPKLLLFEEKYGNNEHLRRRALLFDYELAN